MAEENKIKEQSGESLNALIGSSGFNSLNDDLKNKVIETFHEEKADEAEKNTGIFGRLFGNKAENTSLYIAFIISASLLVIGLIYILIPISYKQDSNLDFWNIIGPIITGALGFIFGAASKK